MQRTFSASLDGNSEIWKSNFEFNYTEITELGRQGLFQNPQICLMSHVPQTRHSLSGPLMVVSDPQGPLLGD